MPHSEIEPRIRRRARKLRKSRTLGEKAMQDYLRALRPFGAHFRREVSIGPYIVDFAWLSARIAIEVDGASHDDPERLVEDAERDGFLASQGFRVIRVRDLDAIANSANAFAAIEEAVRPRLKTPPPAGPSDRQPPPHEGEGRRAEASIPSRDSSQTS
jgi:very-short-patch-repair endonuclease